MADIVLKDRNGNDVTYEGIETVTFDTSTEGQQATFTEGVALEDLEIAPDFSEGDMPIAAVPGILVKSAIIKKPEGLIPENIRNGIEVAGVVGTDIGDTEEASVELDMSEGDQTVEPSAEGKVLSRVIVHKPETLVPDNVAEGVEIGGIVGKFKGGSLENSMKYFLCQVNPAESQVVVHQTLFNVINADTGSLNVSVPSTFAGCQVYLNSGNYAIKVFNNYAVKSIEVAEGVRYVNNSMANIYDGCANFNSPVFVPEGITNMFSTFNNCRAFNQPVSIPNGVLTMANTFSYCLSFDQPVTIPNSVSNMANTFRSCNNFNQPITMPNSVVNLCWAFSGCSNFNQPVNLPNSVTNAYCVFQQCYKFNQPVTIPNSVTALTEAFAFCSNLNSPIVFEPGAPVDFGTSGLLNVFGRCYKFNQPVTIPDHIVGSMTNTFADCNGLRSPIVIGNGITAVIGAFKNCHNLRANVTIGANVTNMYQAFFNAHYAGNVTILSKNVTNFYNAFYSGLAATRNTRLNIFVPADSTTNTRIFNNGQYLRGYNLSWTTNANNNCRYNTYNNIYIYWV